MANQTYNLVCEALSRIVSRKAAENIVSDALRSAKLTPQDVRPEQMQALLKSVVFARLQQIIPVAQAKGEIRQILNALETQFSSRAFSPEVEEGWNALREEFKRIPNPNTPRAQRLAKNIADLPKNADPVRVLNDLWAELDLLQLEATGSSPAPSEPRFQGDLLLESGEYAALNFELELPDNETSPALGRPGAGLVSRPAQSDLLDDVVVRSSQDGITSRPSLDDVVVRSSLDEEVLRETRELAVLHSSQNSQPPSPQDLNLTIIDEPTQPDVPALESNDVPPLELNLDGLIEIPQPHLATPAPPTKRPSKTPILLESAEAQDALLTRFALEEGVTGVLLCKRNGDVVMSRLSSGSPEHLASVVAATTMLLTKRRPFEVFYTHLESVSAFVAPLGQNILTVLADAGVNVGRVFTELESLKETA
jgi:hypothetical protein